MAKKYRNSKPKNRNRSYSVKQTKFYSGNRPLGRKEKEYEIKKTRVKSVKDKNLDRQLKSQERIQKTQLKEKKYEYLAEREKQRAKARMTSSIGGAVGQAGAGVGAGFGMGSVGNTTTTLIKGGTNQDTTPGTSDDETKGTGEVARIVPR